MGISGGRVGRKLFCMNIQCSKASDEQRVALGDAWKDLKTVPQPEFTSRIPWPAGVLPLVYAERIST